MAISKMQELMITTQLDGLFELWNEKKGARTGGVHASSVLQGDGEFCYKEHVLGTAFQGKESIHNARLLAIFLNGWKLHEKWQMLFSGQGMSEDELAAFLTTFITAVEFERVRLGLDSGEEAREAVNAASIREKWGMLFGEVGGIADEVETTHYAHEWGLSFTPDAIIRLNKEPYVVEIKGYREKAYEHIRHLADPMDDIDYRKAAVQANLYMYMLGIEHALILIENKNTQEYLIRVRTYDEAMVAPYIARLQMLKRLIEVFRHPADGRLPKRICASATCSRAQKCPVRDACFASVQGRELLRK